MGEFEGGGSSGSKRGKSPLNVFEKLSCGAVAGMVGKTSVAPFQRIQIMFQVKPGEALSMARCVEVTREVMANEGVRALWRGNFACAGRSAPTAAIKFFTQGNYYTFIRDNKFYTMNNSAAQFWSGALSGVTTVICTYPMDLFRTKLAADPSFKGYMDCTKKTFKAYGMKGFFHGLSAPVIGSIPHTGIAFWSYDYLKRLMGLDSNDPTTQSPIKRTTAGFLAGFAGQTVTYPFSTIRRRMQTSAEWQGKGLIQCFVITMRHEGLAGLFRAYSIHAFKGPLSAGVSFACNDICRNYLTKYHLDRMAKEEQAAYVNASALQKL